MANTHTIYTYVYIYIIIYVFIYSFIYLALEIQAKRKTPVGQWSSRPTGYCKVVPPSFPSWFITRAAKFNSQTRNYWYNELGKKPRNITRVRNQET